jgi:hypothetical protein
MRFTRPTSGRGLERRRHRSDDSVDHYRHSKAAADLNTHYPPAAGRVLERHVLRLVRDRSRNGEKGWGRTSICNFLYWRHRLGLIGANYLWLDCRSFEPDNRYRCGGPDHGCHYPYGSSIAPVPSRAVGRCIGGLGSRGDVA